MDELSKNFVLVIDLIQKAKENTFRKVNEELNLPERFSEFDFKKAIIGNLKNFILEVVKISPLSARNTGFQLETLTIISIFYFTIADLGVWLPLN